MLSRLTEEGETEVNSLYNVYHLESLESNTEPVTRNMFIQNVNVLYPEVKKMRCRGTGSPTIYKGLSIKNIEAVSDHKILFKDIIDLVKRQEFKLVTSDDSTIVFALETLCSSNGNKVYKELKFYRNGRWQLIVSGKEIDLNHLGISDEYTLNDSRSVTLVCKEVKLLKLCEGIKINKRVICSRFHIMENWCSSSNQVQERNNKHLRTANCLRIVPVYSRSSACRLCQKMTFRYEEKIKPSDEKENAQHSDLTSEFRRLIPQASDSMIELLKSQAINVPRDPKGRRWSRSLISVCLQLFTRSPQGYMSLKQSGILVLPSPSLLIMYKNNVQHKVGFNNEVFQWMLKEAIRLEVPAEGLLGGVIMDEMAIQTDLQITKEGDVVEMVGFSDVGEEGNMCGKLRAGRNEQTMGTHILQLLFLGTTGFRFPFAHFISTNVHASELYSIFWDAVDQLQVYGFTVLYTCMDGAPSNRSFMHINLGKTLNGTMSTKSPCSFDKKVIFMMDYSHSAKKIRNNIIKSGIKEHSTRLLTLPRTDSSEAYEIQWQMWIDCFRWDQNNGLSLHRKLTTEHFFPSSQSKMRNHLAEHVLNGDMLHLFLEYQSYLGGKGAVLNGVIQLLRVTSKLIEIFRDRRPVKSMDDERLAELQYVLSWFSDWNAGVTKLDISKTKKSKLIMSSQCQEDLKVCILGFFELCKTLTTRRPPSFVTPALVNSDIIENIFCQQRATYNGANSNPNALQYRHSINNIILGQNIISTKANAGKSGAAESNAFNNPKPLKEKKRKTSPTTAVSSNVKAIKVLRL